MALERSTIVQAALLLLDKVGLQGLSTRKLAQDLNVQGPSLYWHFKSKRELLDHMAETMLTEHLPTPRTIEEPWDAWLAADAYGVRAAALSRRDGAQVLASGRPTGTSPVLSMPDMLRRLKDAGFTDSEAHYAIITIASFTLGWALIEQAADEQTKRADHTAGFEFGLQALLSGMRDRLAARGCTKAGAIERRA